MKTLFTFFLGTFLLCTTAWGEPLREVDQLLSNFHRAASDADGARYFSYFTEDAIFLGTDATERWNLEQFRAYAMPHFSQGRGWTYKMQERHITLGADKKTAWFDEVLLNSNYGTARGSGVVVLQNGRWKVAQYNLSLPIPNAIIKEVVEKIESL